MIDIHAAFGKHLLQLTIVDTIFAVLANSPKDDVALKMPAMERGHVLHLLQKRELSLGIP